MDRVAFGPIPGGSSAPSEDLLELLPSAEPAGLRIEVILSGLAGWGSGIAVLSRGDGAVEFVCPPFTTCPLCDILGDPYGEAACIGGSVGLFLAEFSGESLGVGCELWLKLPWFCDM